jgi:hypothetical protein
MKYEHLLEYLEDKKLQKQINKLAKKYINKKILVYGAGVFFDVIQENFDLSKLNIVAVSDKKFQQQTEYKGFKAIPPFEIKNLAFDVMFIAILEPEKIENNLKANFYPECGKFNIEFLNNYTFKDFCTEVIKCVG